MNIIVNTPENELTNPTITACEIHNPQSNKVNAPNINVSGARGVNGKIIVIMVAIICNSGNPILI